MSQRVVRVDDRTGAISVDANPSGWLTVTVSQIIGGDPIYLDFAGWQQFREWVELSDPGCGKVLDPTKQP
jgi:hypothetical protein